MMRRRLLLLIALVMMLALVGSAQSKKDAAKTQVMWLGHAAFEVVSPGGTRLLIDPFLKENPATPPEFKELKRYKPDAILITHSHGDHLGDAMEIAKLSGAKVMSVNMPEVFRKAELPESQVLTVNVGGTLTVGDVTVHVVPAMHGSEPSGRPVGFVMDFADGNSIYHQGDTWVFGDMALIQEFYHPTIILLNVGGKAYGQSPELALLAANRYFKPKTIIPMHYASLPTLSTEAEVRAAIGKDQRVVFMKPGETKIF